MAQSATKAQNTWDDILGEIRKSVNPHRFNAWLRPTRQEKLEQGVLVVSVPNANLQPVGEKFGPQIEQAIHHLHLDQSVQRVEIVVAASAALPTAAALPAAAPEAVQQKLIFDTL